ncbi:MAG: phosphate acyltransferase [Candidatus Saccharibacteria bacterium]|nr:phosphate acyltransferase [Candidatus Saccharibacteria bacterium]
MKIVFPEIKNVVAEEATRYFRDIEFLGAENLDLAVKMVAEGRADSMISGLDYASREVVIAYKNHLELKSRYFSSCFICEREGRHLVIADGGVNKMPDKEQLYTITEDSARTYADYYGETPKIAMLSYSTAGSGGKNPDLEKIYYVIEKIREEHPEWMIEGEMQLDVAVNSKVARRKVPDSRLRGEANVLIVPDLNSGNILYKALEQFGGFIVAGPIIQGFKMPLADLSRGSTVMDVVLTIGVIRKQLLKFGVS